MADIDKFTAMANNDQWLYENTVRGQDSRTGARKGLLLLGGVEIFTKNPKHARMSHPVAFGGMFTNDPIVVATASTYLIGTLSVTLRGNNQINPGTDGFRVYIQNYRPSKGHGDGITNNVHVHWLAMGPSSLKLSTI